MTCIVTRAKVSLRFNVKKMVIYPIVMGFSLIILCIVLQHGLCGGELGGFATRCRPFKTYQQHSLNFSLLANSLKMSNYLYGSLSLKTNSIFLRNSRFLKIQRIFNQKFSRGLPQNSKNCYADNQSRTLLFPV